MLTRDGFDRLDPVLPSGVIDAFRAVYAGLAAPGQTLTSAQRIEVARVVRNAAPRPLWDKAPDLFSFEHSAPTSSSAPGASEMADGLSPFLQALTERIAVESRSLDRQTVAAIVDRIGDAMYAEVVAIVAQVVPIDHCLRAIDESLEPLPDAGAGDPSLDRPEGLGDIGAFIVATEPYVGPNVARSLSLAGPDNALRLKIVRSMYSGKNFGEMVWTDRALSRPQIELVAARTSALNECFY